jgi:hypothetical protein
MAGEFTSQSFFEKKNPKMAQIPPNYFLKGFELFLLCITIHI